MKVIVNSFLLFFLFSGQVFGEDNLSGTKLTVNAAPAVGVDAPYLKNAKAYQHSFPFLFDTAIGYWSVVPYEYSLSEPPSYRESYESIKELKDRNPLYNTGNLENGFAMGNSITGAGNLPIMGGVMLLDLYYDFGAIKDDSFYRGLAYHIDDTTFTENSIVANDSSGTGFGFVAGGALAVVADPNPDSFVAYNRTLYIAGGEFSKNSVISMASRTSSGSTSGGTDLPTGSIEADFNSASGGALFNLFSTINIDTVNFNENYAVGSEVSEARGGAIANYGGTITIKDSNFQGNHAEAPVVGGFGGAIYNVYYSYANTNDSVDNPVSSRATLNIKAIDSNVSFDDNYVGDKRNDIYNRRSDINLVANEGKTISFTGGIDGDNSTVGENIVNINDNGDTGTVKLVGDAVIQNNTVNMHGGTLSFARLGSQEYFINAPLNIEGNVIFSLENGGNNSATFDKVNGVSGNPIKLDIDIEEGGFEKILPDSIKGSFSNSEFEINHLTLNANDWFQAERTVLNLTDVVTDNNGAAVESLFPGKWWNDEIAPDGVFENSLYKYVVEVDTTNRRVTFIKPDTSRPDSYPGYLYNETVSMRSLADVDHYIIRNILSDTNFKFNLKNENAVTNRRRSNRRSNRRRSRVKPQEESRPSVWFDMLGLKDTVKYDNFHSVDDNSMTAILGVNSKTQRLANGAEGYGNLYLGYLYSEQKYDTNKIESNGVYIGGSGFMSYNSLFGGVTANIGFMSNEAKNKWGKDSYDNYWLSLGTKIGYNYRIRNTGYSLEPALYLSYVFVSGDVYTSKSGEKINQNDLHSFQIAPSLRLSKAFKDNLLLSLRARYVFEMVNDLDVEVRNVSLPELDSDPFVEYGISVDKKFRNSFSIGAELNRRDGGRDGWNGGLNAKFFF